ncbi:MAG TPA: hypothetical protein PK490_10260 [Prosthecobacter sp.]|nr:hypothetical protein [Prosthecobacter sp.]
MSAQDLADGLETRALAIPGMGAWTSRRSPEYSPAQVRDIASKVNGIITGSSRR